MVDKPLFVRDFNLMNFGEVSLMKIPLKISDTNTSKTDEVTIFCSIPQKFPVLQMYQTGCQWRNDSPYLCNRRQHFYLRMSRHFCMSLFMRNLKYHHRAPMNVALVVVMSARLGQATKKKAGLRKLRVVAFYSGWRWRRSFVGNPRRAHLKHAKNFAGVTSAGHRYWMRWRCF